MRPARLLAFLSLIVALPLAVPGVAAAPLSAPAPVVETDSVPLIVDRIMGAVGLENRFTVVASDEILSAAALIIDGRRCIVYNPAFMRAINFVAHTRWAGVSMLAHEIGHHLNGHTLSADARDQQLSYRNELEADEFSGFVLRRLGATAEEAVAALSTLAKEEESRTHPPRSARVAAVAEGWNAAQPTTPLAAALAARQNDTTAVPAPGALRWRLNPESVAGRLVFDAVPEHVLYLTRRLNLVDDDPNGARVMGALEPTKNRRYPYRLVQADGLSTLLVSNKGVVVNQAGRRVGTLTKQ